MTRRTLALALALALAAVEVGGAVWIVATSESETHWARIGLALAAGVTFVISGLIALERRPENRTGLYLAATGYLWLLNALTDSTNEWVFSAGFVVGELVWVPFTALVLAYPTGQLRGRLEAAIPVVVGLLLTTTSLLVLLFDASPAPERCEGCPGSAIVVTDRPGLAGIFSALATLAASR